MDMKRLKESVIYIIVKGFIWQSTVVQMTFGLTPKLGEESLVRVVKISWQRILLTSSDTALGGVK